MEALVLEAVRRISLRPFALPQVVSPRDVRIRIHTVVICGSDIYHCRHGRIGPFVVHPTAFTYKLPDNVRFAESSIVEPLSIGLQNAKKAAIKPSNVAVVLGAGAIGLLWALAAFAGGCSRATVCNLRRETHARRRCAGRDDRENPRAFASRGSQGSDQRRGANVMLKASGNERVFDGIVDLLSRSTT